MIIEISKLSSLHFNLYSYIYSTVNLAIIILLFIFTLKVIMALYPKFAKSRCIIKFEKESFSDFWLSIKLIEPLGFNKTGQHIWSYDFGHYVITSFKYIGTPCHIISFQYTYLLSDFDHYFISFNCIGTPFCLIHDCLSCMIKSYHIIVVTFHGT